MNIEDVKKGHWYIINSYGFTSGIKGRVTDVRGNLITLKFYWGNPFRSRQVVELDRLIGECEAPSLFSNH